MAFGKMARGDPNDTEICKRVWPALADKVYLSGQYMTLAACVKNVITPSEEAVKQVLPANNNIDTIETVVGSVRRSDQMPVEDVVRAFSLKTANPGHQDREVMEVVSVAATLESMTSIQVLPISNTHEKSAVLWECGASLKDTLSKIYNGVLNPDLQHGTLTSHLTIRSLVKFHGYTVVWTDFLNQHLRIDEDSRLVWVFQHKIWLSSQVGRSDCSVPQSVLLEALDTLNVLFPPDDDQTRRFLQRREQEFYSLGYCGRVPSTDLKKYAIWGTKMDRLLGIAKGPRRGIWQFLPTPDRFNVLESANFVIACVALVFSIVGFVLGLVSIIYAKLSYQIGLESIDISKVSLDVSNESLELTRLQYLLSVAQACSDPDQARSLPDFCSAEA